MAVTDEDPPPPLADTEIIRLAQENRLHPYLLSASSHSALLSHLHARALSPSPSRAVSDYALALLSLISLSSPHAPPQQSPLSSLLSPLLVAYTQLFLSDQIPHDANSLKTLTLFTTLLNNNSDSGQISVDDVDSTLDSILLNIAELDSPEDAQILDLFPCLLNLTARRVESGKERVRSVLSTVLESQWSNSVLVKLVSVAKDLIFCFDKVSGREFLEKVFRTMKRAELQDLPSFAYQLLVMASKGFCKREVVEGVVGLFGAGRLTGVGSNSGTVGREVEGTVLLHVNFAVKQDPSLAQEVMGLLKLLDLRTVNHFSVAVLFSVARIKRFKDCAMGALRTALLTAYGDHKFAKDCKWLSDDIKEECLQNVLTLEKAVLRAVNESNRGREHVLPAIVQFSFVLLESLEERKHEKLQKSDGVLGMEELNIQMLKNLFEVHDMARNEIIEQCKSRILSLKPEKSLPIIRLLSCLIQCYPYPMLGHVSRLKELLDYFTFMNGKVASHLIAALVHLMEFSHDLRDYTILVVRKAMFRREDTVCLAAVNAFINLILAEKQYKREGPFSFQDSSSQASCSQQAEISRYKGAGLFQELSGLLQRCLNQNDANIREVIYRGLVKLVLLDPASGGAVFDFLLPHFLHFFKEDADVQLEIGRCIKSENGKVVIEEPLDCLISTASWVLLLQPQGKTDGPDSSWACFGFSLSQEIEVGRNKSSETFSNALLKIQKLLRKGNLEDILGRTQDAGSTSQVAENKKCCALLLSGIVEVVLNTIAMELEKATDSKMVDLEREIVEFVKLYESLDHRSVGQRTGVQRGNIRAPALDMPANIDGSVNRLTEERTPFLATSSLCQLMQTAFKLYKSEYSTYFSASQNSSQLSSGKILECFKIISFVLNCSMRHLKSYPTRGKEDSLKILIFGEIKLLGPPLLQLILMLKSGPKFAIDQKKETKSKKVIEDKKEHLHLALLCLKELMTISLQQSCLTDLLEDLLPISTSNGYDEECEASGIDDKQIRIKQLFIVKVLRPLFNELLSLSSFCEIEVLCDLVLMIGDKLPCKWRSSHGSWGLHVCKSNGIKNSKVAKSMVALTFCLTPAPDDLVLAEDIVLELLKVNGSDKNDPSEESESYPVINQSTKTALNSCILQLIEAVIADLDWCIRKLKVCSLLAQRSIHPIQDEKQASGLAFENNVYTRAEAVVKVLSSFVLMSLKDPQADHLLRLSTKFYKQLALMTRLRIAPKGCKQLLPSLTFQKLAELTCKRFTAPLYNFVAEIQREQQENTNAKGIINKIKKENKRIPDLIFQIEDYERYLIQLSKVSKFNLLKHAKRSTSRDFKILDPEKVLREEDVLNHEACHDAAAAAMNGSQEDAEDSQDDESAKGFSPRCDSRLAAEESESDVENEDALPSAKRVKRSKVVQDSDDES